MSADMGGKVKVGFVLLSNSGKPIPSTRIGALNMFPFLRAAQFDPHIVFDPQASSDQPDVTGLAEHIVAERFDVIVFQKVMGASVEKLVHDLGLAGVRTVFCVCDVVDAAMAEATDATVVVTDFLKSLYPAPLHHKIHVVHDGIEQPQIERLPVSTRRGSLAAPLRAVLVTSSYLESIPQIVVPPPWLSITIVGRYYDTLFQRLRQSRWALALGSGDARLDYLRFLANPRIRCVPWSANTVYEHMRQADIAIIPIDAQESLDPAEVPSWKVKSENRLSMKMALGLPVIATPIPSYLPLVVQGENGFFANTRTEWMACLETLRDPAERARIGDAARASVLQRFSTEEQARLLIGVLASLVR